MPPRSWFAAMDMEERLTLLLKRGYLLAQEATGLRDEFRDVLDSDPDVADRLDQIDVRASPADDLDFRLNLSIEMQLRDWLAQVMASSIYDVLRSVDDKVTVSSPLEVLTAAADTLYRNAHLHMNKNDPLVKARERISGLAKTIFSSEEGRQRHDMSMRLARIQARIEWFERVLHIAKSVTAAQFEWFLELARIRWHR